MANKRYQTVNELLDDLRLVISGDLVFTAPAERFRKSMVAYQATPENDEHIERMARILVENPDDSALRILLAHLPEDILQRLLIDQVGMMTTVLENFDAEVSGDIGFEYCDTVADFYARVFDNTTSHRLRTLVLERLALMGPRHNRWHVGHVLGRLVNGLRDESLLLELRRVLADDSGSARWNEEYLTDVPPIIKEVLRGA